MMLQRCRNPNNTNYANYGGRGIWVCERWLVFTNFLEDMGERPVGTSLERDDNSVGYHPENCVWATRKVQQRNRRSNRMLTANGVTQCAQDWANDLGVPMHTITTRIDRYGWSVEDAITTPSLGVGHRRTDRLLAS